MNNQDYLLTAAASRKSLQELFLSAFCSLNENISLTWNEHWSEAQKLIIAEEILRLNFIENINLDIPDEFKQYLFFKNIPLTKLLKAECASVSLFPLNNKMNNHLPVLAHLWLFKGLNITIEDDLLHLEGNQIINTRFNIFITTSINNSIKDINGTSWQLAYKLAEKAITASSSKIKKRLSNEWIATGTIANETDTVLPINLGNKLSLPLKKHIKWLIPFENMKDITQEQQQNIKIRAVDSLNSALNHISGEGTRNINKSRLPNSIDELHILVGGNIKAQIASIILTQPSKIILWHSDNYNYSILPSNNIIDILKILLPEFNNISMKLLSNENIQKAENALRNYFDQDTSKKIIFNVTSGNRLMSYAVQTIARLFPRINLIYRELGEEKPHQFVMLNYREIPPYSGNVTGTLPSEFNNLNISFLYGKEPYTSVDDFIQKLIFEKYHVNTRSKNSDLT